MPSNNRDGNITLYPPWKPCDVATGPLEHVERTEQIERAGDRRGPAVPIGCRRPVGRSGPRSQSDRRDRGRSSHGKARLLRRSAFSANGYPEVGSMGAPPHERHQSICRQRAVPSSRPQAPPQSSLDHAELAAISITQYARRAVTPHQTSRELARRTSARSGKH